MTLTVNRTSVAAALGLATTLQNFFIATFSYFFGYVNLARTHTTYDTSFLYLAFIGIGSLCLSISVLIVDHRSGRILSLPDRDSRIAALRKAMQLKFNHESAQRSEKLKRPRESIIQPSKIIRAIRKFSADIDNNAKECQQA